MPVMMLLKLKTDERVLRLIKSLLNMKKAGKQGNQMDRILWKYF